MIDPPRWPAAWLSVDGVIHDALSEQHGPALALPAQTVMKRAFVSTCAKIVICHLFPPPWNFGVMAYSLQTGQPIWPEPVECCSCISDWAMADDHVWLVKDVRVLRRITYRLVAVSIATGAVEASLPYDSMLGSYAVVAHGYRKNHLLVVGSTYAPEYYTVITLYTPGGAEQVWQVTQPESSFRSTLYPVGDDWFFRKPGVMDSDAVELGAVTQTLHSLRDGSVIPSMLDTAPRPMDDEFAPWPEEIVAAWGQPAAAPDSMRILLVDQADTLELAVGDYASRRELDRRPRGGNYAVFQRFAVEPHRPGETMTIVDPGGCMLVVDPAAALVVDRIPTPGIMAAWYTPRQHALRECAAIRNAVAAVDELALGTEPMDVSEAVGLVRAVLVGFVAEDARLSVLRLR